MRSIHARRRSGMVLFGGALLLGTTMLSAPAGAETLSELKERLIELKAKVAGCSVWRAKATAPSPNWKGS